MPLVELDTTVLRDTSVLLHRRIGERFPESGLEQRAEDLVQIIDQIRRRADTIAQPIRWIRGLYVVLGLLVLVGLLTVPVDLPAAGDLTLKDWIPLIESAINDLLLLGAGLFFLATVETRIKRGRALKELHEIRSFAHVIDMMQLTKDPQRQVGGADRATPSSPVPSMGAFELGRYLDYCSELLSLSAKGAALIAERFDDPAVLAAVTEIETLTTGLSRKIWQKLMILMTTHPDAVPRPSASDAPTEV